MPDKDVREFPWPKSKAVRYAAYVAVTLGFMAIPIVTWFVMGLWL